MFNQRVSHIAIALLLICIVRIKENKFDKNHFTFWYCNNEIFILNNNVLNFTTILHSCNDAWDTSNNNINNYIKPLHWNMEMAVTVQTSLLIVALQLLMT